MPFTPVRRRLPLRLRRAEREELRTVLEIVTETLTRSLETEGCEAQTTAARGTGLGLGAVSAHVGATPPPRVLVPDSDEASPDLDGRDGGAPPGGAPQDEEGGAKHTPPPQLPSQIDAPLPSPLSALRRVSRECARRRPLLILNHTLDSVARAGEARPCAHAREPLYLRASRYISEARPCAHARVDRRALVILNRHSRESVSPCSPAVGAFLPDSPREQPSVPGLQL